jgi:hypothetical protein
MAVFILVCVCQSFQKPSFGLTQSNQTKQIKPATVVKVGLSFQNVQARPKPSMMAQLQLGLA